MEKIIAWIMVVLSALHALLPVVPHGEPLNLDGYTLVFEDEFDGGALNTDVWVHRAEGERRCGFNAAEQVRVEDGKDLVGETKTEEGNRKIVLPETLRKRLLERKKNAYGAWIFHCPTDPSRPLDPKSAYNKLKWALRKAGLPDLRFHDLRHTFATLAASGGIDPKTLAGILGHTNAAFTLDTYTHVTGEMQQHASKVIGAMMTDILGKELTPWENANPAKV